MPKLDDYLVPIGKAKVARAGTDVTIVAWSMGMTYALKAADELAKDNISAEVIDLRTLKPMDIETHHRVGEEDRPRRHRRGRLAAVGRRRRDRRRRDRRARSTGSTRRCTRVTGKDVPMPYAANLEKLALPSVADVVEAAKAVCYR